MNTASTLQSGQTTAPGSLYRKWFLLILMLIYASSMIDRIFISVVGRAIKAAMDLSDLELGVLGGLAFSLFYATLSIPMARLAERYSRVVLISLSIIAWSIMTALCGVAGNFWWLLLFRLGVGIGEAGSTPTSHSLISDVFPEGRRATALSLYSLGPPLGVIISAILGGWVAQHFGWRIAFMVVGIPGAVLGILAWLTLREPVRGHAEHPDAQPSSEVPSLREVMRALFARKVFIHLLLGIMIGAFSQYGINLFLPIYLGRSFNMNLAEAGMALALIVGIGGLVGNAAGGYLADRWGARDRRWYAWVPALGTILGFVLMPFAFLMSSWQIATPMLLIATILLSAWGGPAFSIVHSLVAPRMRATSAALVFLFMNFVGQGCGPVVAGFLSDHIAAHLFPYGDMHVLCSFGPHGAHAPVMAGGGQYEAACASASTHGLRYAMVLMSLPLLWSAWHFYRASRHMTKTTPAALHSGAA
jgi:predicted MFS family arabinose efflux permease